MTKFPDKMGWVDKIQPSHTPKENHFVLAILADGLKTSPCTANTTGQKLVLSAELFYKGNTCYCVLRSCWGAASAKAGGGGYGKQTEALHIALKNLGIEINFEGRSLDSAAIFLAEEIGRIFQIKTSVLVL
jgi:hypothetical protein